MDRSILIALILYAILLFIDFATNILNYIPFLETIAESITESIIETISAIIVAFIAIKAGLFK